MPVIRSTAAERRQRAATSRRPPAARPVEFAALALATLAIAAGLFLVWRAKAPDLTAPASINLNALERREQLLPALGFAPNARERQFLASRIWSFLQDGKVPNVGALSRIPGRDGKGRLLSFGEIASIKPAVVVRTPGEFRTALFGSAALFFSCFWIVHLFWRFRGFTGDQILLPAVMLLSGAGLTLMISMRDPLRDTLSMADFTQSVALGSAALAALSMVTLERWTGRLSYLPLLAAILLSTALILFGTGPGVSDAKVNLLGFQPVELIKILLVLFLAGYFSRRWEFLRVLKERRPELARVTRFLDIPKLEYLMPVLLAVGLSLVFFFLQKDLGPALIITCVFLSLYSIARGKAFLAIAGLALLGAGFFTGYLLGYPRTVATRVSMWLSPWDNAVRGGEQVVHALWAFATGGIFGTGAGLGTPGLMPAAHTDLILAVLGEEWGFVGVLAVFLLFALLTVSGFRIAMRTRTDYGFFLGLGLTLLLTFGFLLIAGGVLDLFPLSGVVTPFLSYGGTAMVTNFAIVGVLLSLSTDRGDAERSLPFRMPVRRMLQTIAVVVLVIAGKAAWVQVIRADETAGAGALTLQADGYRRYQYNPRLLAIARSIPRGTIYDRNGVPLATSDPKLLAKHRDAYARMGISLGSFGSDEIRHYPLGAPATHLLGDLRTRANWGARNSSLAERDSMVRLQGYDDRARVVEVEHPATGAVTYTVRHDFRELLPLLRHRHEPGHPEVRRILERPRDLRMSIDARLQMRAARILEAGLKRLGKKKGALVVMDPRTGDLLASVSYPWPEQMPPVLGPDDGIDEMLDRARYGLYPPGSTFKLVTALAALRKNPELKNAAYVCRALPDGRVGNFVKGWGRPIRDDVADRAPHGNVNMLKGTVVSCNAYYAQLGVYGVGAEALRQTADLLGIATGNLKDSLPQAAYGQGQVVASPFQMARVAATVANGGKMPYGRWVLDESNPRMEPPTAIVPEQQARTLGEYMRGVVTGGTGRAAAGAPVPVAGKTGTAEVERKPSHAWFAGFAPYGAPRMAFAVLVENGQYGGSAAAPIAREVVAAAAELGLAR